MTYCISGVHPCVPSATAVSKPASGRQAPSHCRLHNAGCRPRPRGSFRPRHRRPLVFASLGVGRSRPVPPFSPLLLRRMLLAIGACDIANFFLDPSLPATARTALCRPAACDEGPASLIVLEGELKMVVTRKGSDQFQVSTV